MNAFEGVDEELAKARESVSIAQLALNQSLTKQLRLMQSHPTTALTSKSSPNYLDPDKFNGDKTKLEAFVTQLRIKLQQNANYFVRPGQNTEQNWLSYTIFCLEGEAFIQVKLFVSQSGIDLADVAALEDLLKARFGEVDPVGTAKHEMYRLYQANKVLEVFLNTFLVLAKKAKLNDNQTLDLLYEKLSDKFKSLFVTKKRQTNLGDLIKKLHSMNASMKVISQRKRPAASAANTANNKLAFISSSKPTY